MNYSLDLIKNTYSASEAKKIIVDLLTSKINFLNNQIFEEQERYGIHSEAKLNRVSELRLEVEKLKDILQKAEREESEVSLKCQIIMDFNSGKNSVNL